MRVKKENKEEKSRQWQLKEQDEIGESLPRKMFFEKKDDQAGACG